MDPRNRADEALARARARGAFVVTPDNATSPMDSSSTVRIPREAVDGADRDELDPESTVIIPQAPADDGSAVQWPPPGNAGQPHRGGPHQDEYQQDWPTQQPGGYEAPAREAIPPNPYQSRRNPGEFGPLGSNATQQYPYQ